MKLSDFKNYLQSNESTSQFLVRVYEEVNEFERQLAKVGSAASIIVDEDVDFILKKTELEKLCDDFIKGVINIYHLQYFADAILMSDNLSFENGSNIEVVELMTNPEINGVQLNVEFILELKSRLV